MYIYIFLILFGLSLIGIITMIGRKFILIKNNNIEIEEKNIFEIPHLEKVRHLTITNIKKYGRISLIKIVRFYLKSKNFLKKKNEDLKEKLKNLHSKKHLNGEEKEISKFLRTVADYKRKIREITHKIKKEENL